MTIRWRAGHILEYLLSEVRGKLSSETDPFAIAHANREAPKVIPGFDRFSTQFCRINEARNLALIPIHLESAPSVEVSSPFYQHII